MSAYKRRRLRHDLGEIDTPYGRVRVDRKTETTDIKSGKSEKDDIVCRGVATAPHKPSFRDIVDVLFPKFFWRNRGYIPRWLPFDYNSITGATGGLVANVVDLPPCDGTINLYQVNGIEPKQIWVQFPHMSCMEYQLLAAKYQDLTNYNMTAAAQAAAQGINNTTTVASSQWTSQKRQLAVNNYIVEYEFTNLATIEMWIEIVVVAPKDMIFEPLNSSTAPVAGAYPSTYFNGSPLATLCQDHARMHPQANAVLPKDSNDVNFGLASNSASLPNQACSSVKGYKIEPYHRLFHQRFSVTDKKLVKLEPGQKLVYDLVIPSFKRDSDFTAELGQYNMSGTSFQFVPTYFKKSRFLMLRAWSENVINVFDQQMTPGDGKIGIVCKKQASIRTMPPNRDFVTIQSNIFNDMYDIDWAGKQSTTQRINGCDIAYQDTINEESDQVNDVTTG